MKTDSSKQIQILGQFYQNYRDDENLADFIEFNDLGLPLAYLAAEGLCQVSDDGLRYISETWDLLMAALEIQDEGFDSLDQIFDKKKE